MRLHWVLYDEIRVDPDVRNHAAAEPLQRIKVKVFTVFFLLFWPGDLPTVNHVLRNMTAE